MIKVYMPVKCSDGDEITLIKNKQGKVMWWNITKGLLALMNTPFMRWIKQIAESEG